MHHIGKLLGSLAANDAFANATRAARQRFTFSQEPQRGDTIGLNGCAAVEDARIGSRHRDQGAFGCAEGQSGAIGQRVL